MLIYVLYANSLDPKIGRPSLVWAVVIILAAAAYYKFVLARRGAWVLQAPAPEQHNPGERGVLPHAPLPFSGLAE
jgi:hypothetical protein